MLKIDVKERISWEEYFNHSFFKQNVIQIPQFVKYILKILISIVRNVKLIFVKIVLINIINMKLNLFLK